MVSQKGRNLEVAILLLAFLVANLMGAKYQKQISFNDGKGWEGVGYTQVAEQFAIHAPLSAEAPMVYRVGTPFLAAKISPDNLFRGFRIVNLVANFVTIALLIVWLRLYLPDWRIRTALGLMFITQWDTPVRWLWFYPAHTDPMLWVFLLAGCITLHRLKHLNEDLSPRPLLVLLCGIAFVGVIFREVALIVPISLLFLRNPIRRVEGLIGTLKSAEWPRPGYFAPLVWGFVALYLLRKIATPSEPFSFGQTAYQWAYAKPFLTYIHGWFLAYGPVLFLLVFRWRSAWRFLKQEQFLLVILVFFALMGYIGGTDTERLLYWSMPAVFVLLGRAMEEVKPLFRGAPLALAILIAAQLLGSRAFLITPDYVQGIVSHSKPILTPLGKSTYFMDLYSFHGTPLVRFFSFVEYLAFGFLLCEWLNYRRRKMRTIPMTFETAIVREKSGDKSSETKLAEAT